MYGMVITIICIVLLFKYVNCVKENFELKEMHNKNILIEVPIIELGDILYEDETGYNMYFVDTKYVKISNDDEFFYKSVEEKKDIYTNLVKGYQEIYKMLREGQKVEDIMKVECLSEISRSCFGMTSRIHGSIMDDKICIDDGRHRYVVAKELGCKIPIFISRKRYISYKID